MFIFCLFFSYVYFLNNHHHVLIYIFTVPGWGNVSSDMYKIVRSMVLLVLKRFLALLVQFWLWRSSAKPTEMNTCHRCDKKYCGKPPALCQGLATVQASGLQYHRVVCVCVCMYVQLWYGNNYQMLKKHTHIENRTSFFFLSESGLNCPSHNYENNNDSWLRSKWILFLRYW